MLGQRVKALRKRHHLSQDMLAEMVGTSPSQISLIENNKSKPSLTVGIAVARALGSSLDFLTGVVDDDRRSTLVVAENRKLSRRLHECEAGLRADGFGHVAAGFHGISVRDTVTGTGRIPQKPIVKAKVMFPIGWSKAEGLDLSTCEIIGVVGESMAPTLPDGCLILVNSENTDLEDGKIFVIRTDDELLVRRALKHKTERWLLSSDNPDMKAWPTIPGDKQLIVGEVRWMWHSLP